MSAEYRAVKPTSVKIGDKDYELLFTFGKIKRIRESLKVDLLKNENVELDVFTKVLYEGLVDPGDLTVEALDDLISVPQIPYYVDRLQEAIQGHTQPSEATKNALSASVATSGSATNPSQPKKPNSGSGQPQSASTVSATNSSGA